MIKHKDLTEYLREAGFTTGFSRVDRQPQNEAKVYLAQNDEKGVAIKWQEMPDGQTRISFRIRTGAGGNFGPYSPWSVLKDLSVIDGYRGAPSQRKQVTRKNLPVPYTFRQDRIIAMQHGTNTRYVRTGVIAKATLAGVVGIQDNAKIDVDMAAKPDEPVWFHFDCEGYAGATFDIITDGDVWYPINRRSQRITTQMKPKKSVDLTNMSIIDHEFLHAAIQDFATKM